MTVRELKEILSKFDDHFHIEIDNSNEEYGPSDITFIVQTGTSLLLSDTSEWAYKLKHKNTEDKWIVYKEKY